MTPPARLRVRAERGQAPELARRAFDELAGLAGGVEAMHRAIAGRVFGATGPGALPARALHDAISAGVYAAVRAGASVTGAAAARALGRRTGEPEAVSAHPRGAILLGILNGLVGDDLERQGSALAEPMAVRVDGREVRPQPDALAGAFPSAGPHVVVFLHGLMETERAWRLGAHEPYGERLARELGCTAVYVRYNTGRRISENGRSLCELLDALVGAWPVDVERLSLVGHSMGGLVARSACCHAGESGAGWARLVRHTVSLGTPHLGAPLEEGVHLASAALDAVPETRPFARFLRRRSGGIRDLRRGSLVDEDWQGRDPDALRAAAVREVPLLEGATHCFVAATLTRNPRHPVGRLLGDCLVLEDSASGRSRTRRIGFRDEYGLHVGGINHFALLNHPKVYAWLRRWLQDSPAPLPDVRSPAPAPAPEGRRPQPG